MELGDRIEQRVDSLLGQMTLAEKVDLIAGVDSFYLRGVPRLGVPRFSMADGPMGLRNDGPATAYGGGIALAATWNPSLVERVGVEFGRDARAKGVHFLLAPGVNIYRAPIAARNFEYFGEDPWLASRIAVGFINGVQSQGVSATIKHFVANNSEFDRNHTDSIVDERTLREIYLPAFEAAVQEAQVGAIMGGYNLTNGLYMSQNAYLNNEVAKGEWGFSGVIMSDWISTYDAVGAANGGLDIEMPSGSHFNRENLLPAVEEGAVSITTIDDKVRRILRLAARFGWLDREQLDLSIPRYNPRGRELALQAAREGLVLLKNEGALLPLDSDRVKSILLVGPNAYPAVTGAGGSSMVQPFSSVSLLEGLSEIAGPDVTVRYSRGLPPLSETVRAIDFSTAPGGGEPGMSAEYFNSSDLTGTPVVSRIEPRVAIGLDPDGAHFPDGTRSERWTGYFTADESGLFDCFVAASGDGGGFYRLRINDETVIDNWTVSRAMADYATVILDAGPHKVVLEHHGRQKWPGDRLWLGISAHGDRIEAAASAMAADADLIVVAAGFDAATESEGGDRTFRLPPGQDELIKAMAATMKPTVVVLNSGGAVDMLDWLDDVEAVLQAWYPGQEGGTAAAEILFGAVNPSGRLPATFERRREDNPAYDHYYPEPGTQRIVYGEGVFVGYRGFERSGTEPLFPFGHGLSYAAFEYSNLALPVEIGSDGGARVAFDLTNTSRRAGAEVAQVYVSDRHSPVERPLKELKGFAKVHLQPGETQRVTIDLNRRAFSYYDAESGQWRATPGSFEVLVGQSSASIRLRGSLELKE
jgi:beta-glucosidase